MTVQVQRALTRLLWCVLQPDRGIAGMPVNGPKQSKIPQTNATTATVLAGGFSPRGNPVFGSIVMACIAMVSGEPVIGLAGGPYPPGPGGP